MEEETKVDFNQAYWRRTVAERVQEVFDTHLLNNAEDGFRSHLGWSVIGHPCLRYIWYHFRWFKRETHSARMLEIFEEGHREEAKIRQLMKACGAIFLDKVDETGEQLQVSDLNGHFGGSCDGVFIWPTIGILEPMLLECKTSKMGATFNDLSKKEVSGAKPQHYAQASGYGKSFNIPFALYVCRNKNDSSLYIEVVDLDFSLAEEMRNKAWHLINTKVAPNKISKKRNYFVCNMCALQTVCHDKEQVVPNCRNCQSSKPVENGQWYCETHQAIIPKEFLIKGCSQHIPLEH